MVVTKTDVSNDLPELTSLITVADGEIVEANTENVNNTTILGPLIVAMNWIIDQGMQAAVESIATALQRFQGGIRVDAIASETTNGNITITTTGAGIVRIADATYAAGQVLTLTNYDTLVGNGYAGAAAASAAAAAASASSASTSASTATTQASTATTQASNASTSASTATTQASNASVSAAAAAVSAAAAAAAAPVSVVEGRLTLASGTPVTTTDQTAKTTIYFTPYQGYKIALYDGSLWNIRTFTEISVAVPSTTVTPFDIFAYDNAGTVTLETTNWTNDTTRATALTTQNGVYVKTGAVTRRYLGTGRTTSVSGQTQVTSGSLLLVNYYNLVDYELVATGGGDWLTSTSSFASVAANTTVGQGRVEFLVPVQEQNVIATHVGTASGDSSDVNAAVGIGVDSTSTNSAQIITGAYAVGAVVPANTFAKYGAKLAVGYHYIQRIGRTQTGNATTFWNNYNSFGASALLAEVKG